MQHLVHKLSKHDELVVDLFSSTFVTTTECFLLLRLCNFLGFKVDDVYFASSMEGLAVMYTRQIELEVGHYGY